MPHQCVHCGNIFPDAAKEILEGCSCGSHFFYYIKDMPTEEVKDTIVELEKSDKTQIERDIREITGLEKEPEKPVILDLESIKVIRPGKFEIDIVNLFSKKRPLIYKLEEGKYIIDLAASLKVSQEEIDKKIRDPNAMPQFSKDAEENKG
ncbi:MAG: Zn-ribbon containing protein [Candidatus Nanoarchaeia archaeon]|nr:Zn-ribbon containing protein [Candidatus Nanoarchaeia archaeon]MDD5741286.1 Zn-ribbon containing protein [Candidatus Nanoarchaeia archaeon]